MIYIHKSTEPREFVDWKKAKPRATYRILRGAVKGKVQATLLSEQGYLCAFCGCRIGSTDGSGTFRNLLPGVRPVESDGRVAHIVPQSVNPALSLDYSNLCFSCSAEPGKPLRDKQHCDREQGNRNLPVTPLMIDVHEFFIFTRDGEILPTSKSKVEAAETIATLNLNAGRLRTKRREIIKAIDELLKTVDSDDLAKNFSKKDQSGCYSEMFFVVLSLFKKTEYHFV